jgi:uncharacterized protein (DUF169 family)
MMMVAHNSNLVDLAPKRRGHSRAAMTAPEKHPLVLLEETIGGRWTGVEFHLDRIPAGKRITRPMRFCEAVAESFTKTIVVPGDYICCPGARWCLRLDNSERELVQSIENEWRISSAKAHRAVIETPCLPQQLMAVTLGRSSSPDVAIGYLQPVAAMKLVRRWQRMNGRAPTTQLSSLMSICGHVAVAAFGTRDLCVSFGCRESRKCAGLGDNVLVVGVPCWLLREVLQ